MADPAEVEKPDEEFCVCCFASSSDGSWGCTVSGGHCMNCGAAGSSVLMQRWAIESIRKQASWVGKRYYSNEEDVQAAAEIKLLRGLAGDPPGRTAKPSLTSSGFWDVKQKTEKGWISVMVEATTEQEALDMGRSKLPYVVVTS